MNDTPRSRFLRALPPVDGVIADPELDALRRSHPALPLARLVREALAALRDDPDAPRRFGDADRERIRRDVVASVRARVEALRDGGLREVLNATGVILHTNLGRAPWSDDAVAAATTAMRGYVSLEVDLETGRRSRRGETVEALAALACGTEAAMVVNNNAAAVHLVVDSLCPPARVIVSRGELVEIGGSFRLPEILRHAAGEVVEVGTTNRTYADDYAQAAREGDVLLKVHKSNYEIEGFAHEASAAELVEVARRRGCRVVYDLGSGALVDVHAAGGAHEVRVADVVATGVDAVTLSGDKLLGGPQAGIVAGRADLVARCRRNPLRRAVRVDKVTVASLESVLRAYVFGKDPRADLPVLAMAAVPAAELHRRAEAIAARLGAPASVRVSVEDDDGATGGGSLATASVPSAALVLRCADAASAVRLARRLRAGRPAVFARVRERDVRLNLRAVPPGEDARLAAAVAAALADPPER